MLFTRRHPDELRRDGADDRSTCAAGIASETPTPATHERRDELGDQGGVQRPGDARDPCHPDRLQHEADDEERGRSPMRSVSAPAPWTARASVSASRWSARAQTPRTRRQTARPMA